MCFVVSPAFAVKHRAHIIADNTVQGDGKNESLRLNVISLHACYLLDCSSVFFSCPADSLEIRAHGHKPGDCVFESHQNNNFFKSED